MVPSHGKRKLGNPEFENPVMRKFGVVFSLMMVSMLVACGPQETEQEAEVGDPRVAATPTAPASSAANDAHRKASAELDAVLKGLPADAGISQEQAAWKANLVASCETVTPADEKLGCETRLVQARVTSLRERFPN